MSAAANPPSRRLRVLQCITRLGLGGAERVAFTLIRALRQDIDFGVFTVHGMSADAVGELMRTELRSSSTPWFQGTRVPMKWGGMVPGARGLANAVAAFRPDVLHFHSETPEACGAAFEFLFSRPSQPALVRTIHNSIFWRYWPRIGNWCDRRLHRAEIACVSEAALVEFNRYREASGAPRPTTPPTVIYNGLDLEFRPSPGRLRQPPLIRVLFAGRFEFQKGVDLVCAAAPLVALPPGASVELTFVGDGVLRSHIEAWAANAPRGWTVRLRPPVSDLPSILDQFDLVVMPSRFEGLGLVAIEATIRGLPVVAARAPGLSETLPADYPWWARPEDSGDLAAALGKAMSEASQWPAIVDHAQAFVRTRFSLEQMRRHYGALYHRNAPPEVRVPAGVSGG